jgi:hypothetical protein
METQGVSCEVGTELSNVTSLELETQAGPGYKRRQVLASRR